MSIHTSLVFIDPSCNRDLRARPGIRPVVSVSRQTDPRSDGARTKLIWHIPSDQGSGQVVCVSLALILLAFVGASPQNIYSFE